MEVTKIDLSFSVRRHQVRNVRKYKPTSDDPLDYNTAATHGLVDGKLYTITERGEYSFELSNGEYYQKNCNTVIWLRLYEIDYKNVDFATW